MIRLRRRHGIAGTILIVIVVVGLALGAAAQTGARGSIALAAVTPVQGIDVSSLQGASINWTDVARSERFAAVKASEGNYYTDTPDYGDDVTAAAAAGLYVMPYVFANPYESNAANPNTGNGWGTRLRPMTGGRVIGSESPLPRTRRATLMLPVVVDRENDPYVNTGDQQQRSATR